MVNAQSPLARIVGKPTSESAHVQGAHGVRAEGAEAHGRDVQQGGGVGLCALRPPHLHPEVSPRILHCAAWACGMAHEAVPIAIHIEFGAEGLHGFDALRAPIDQIPGIAIEGATAGVALHEVLVDFGPSALEQEAQMPEDRIVAQDTVLSLHQVVGPDREQSARGSDREVEDRPTEPQQAECRQEQK